MVNLNTPLGVSKKQPERAKFFVPRWASGLLALLPFVVFLGWILVVDDPDGGRAIGRIEVANVLKSLHDGQGDVVEAQSQTGTESQSTGDQSVQAQAKTNGGPQIIQIPQNKVAQNDGSDVVRISDPSQVNDYGGIRIADDREGVVAALQPAPNRALIEKSQFGLLPVVAVNGTTPLEYYRRPAGPLEQNARAKVAIVMSGLGLSEKLTREAVETLPQRVSFAFVPYARNLQDQIDAARERGHEVLMQVPLEPFDYPANDPGPHTLLTSLSYQKNQERLHWLMSRAQGYIGLMNHMGARFSASEESARVIVDEIAQRGLMYFDDGLSPRSVVEELAQLQNAAATQAHLIVDEVLSSDAIDGQLAKLEAIALQEGRAIGTMSVLSLSIDRLEKWSRTLEQRGVTLVPVSSLLDKVAL